MKAHTSSTTRFLKCRIDKSCNEDYWPQVRPASVLLTKQEKPEILLSEDSGMRNHRRSRSHKFRDLEVWRTAGKNGDPRGTSSDRPQ